MTKAQFKAEVVADLVYQWELKKTGWTSEHWYFSQTLYDLGRLTKEKAIEELIDEGCVIRASSKDYIDGEEFTVLATAKPSGIAS
jgi:hypothetical protein